MLSLYNTLTRNIEPFAPLHPMVVNYYSCGPTVYDYAHIGHARTYVFADILERVLRFHNFSVKRVMNITDVGHLTSDRDTGEDKMEKGARKEGKSVWDIAKFYTDDFFLMMEKLNIKKPEIICRATDYIPQMIDLVKTLENKGYTYTTADGVYFDTAKLADYGKLTGHTFEALQKTLKAGARVEVVEGKKHPTDFALWKLSHPKKRPASAQGSGEARQMEWDSPWGVGFPGWHIECSAMSMKLLGETLDIHTGGVDHIPIHHTNEIAQSEAATGKPFVRFWLHGEHLLVEGEKMSKSLGNFLKVSDIEAKGFSPLTLRYLFLTAHYRQQMNFTWDALSAAQNAYTSLLSYITSIAHQKETHARDSLSGEKMEKVDILRTTFTRAISSDLNMPQAVAVVWEMVKSNIPPADKWDLLLLFDSVLGLSLQDAAKERTHAAIPADISALAQKREMLRKTGKFTEADAVRQDIEKRGFSVEDTPHGSRVIRS